MVSKANHQILIFTSNLASSDIEDVVHELVKDKKVRCYLLTASKTYEILKKSPFEDMVIRSKSSINCTFVIVDPKTKPAGIWSPDPLVEPEFKRTIKLEQGQIKELFGYFIQHFWSSQKEIFFGVEKDLRKLEISKNELIAFDQQSTMMPTNLRNIDDKFFGKKHFLTLPRFTHASIDDTLLMDDTEVLLFEPGKLTKELVKSVNDKAEIYIGLTQEMLLENSKTSWVFTEEFGIRLHPSQMRIVKTWNTPMWKYVLKQKIGEITTPIIPSQASWVDLNPVSIEDEIIENVPPVSFEDIDDWLEEYKLHQQDRIRTDFQLEEKERLARSIKAVRNIAPPFLEEDATKHRIYQIWPELLKKISSIIDRNLETIDKIRNHEKSFKDKTTNKSIKDFIKNHTKKYDHLYTIRNKIDDLLNQCESMPSWNDNEIMSYIDQVNQISEKILNSTRDLSTIIENQKNADLDELEVLKQKKFKLKKERMNLLDYLKKYSKTNLRDLQIDPKSRPPYLPPTTGELWEYKNYNFIVIEEIEEIEHAKALASKFENALIAVKR